MCIDETSELAESQSSAQTETKWLVVRQVMQSANFAPAGRLKMNGWITLLSLLQHTGMEKQQINHGKETSSGMLKLKNIKSELAKKWSVISNQNKMVGGETGNAP